MTVNSPSIDDETTSGALNIDVGKDKTPIKYRKTIEFEAPFNPLNWAKDFLPHNHNDEKLQQQLGRD